MSRASCVPEHPTGGAGADDASTSFGAGMDAARPRDPEKKVEVVRIPAPTAVGSDSGTKADATGIKSRAYVRIERRGEGDGDAPLVESVSPGRLCVVDHPIVQRALAALRDQDTAPDQFRMNSQRIVLFLLVEATRTLLRADGNRLAEGGVAEQRSRDLAFVFLSLNRFGLGLAHQMADCVPESVAGLVSIEKTDTDAQAARLHLVRCPALSEARVVLFAPVIETGRHTCLALDLLLNSGAKNVSVLSLVASSRGLERIRKATRGVCVWTAAVDGEGDSRKGGLKPGIGNFAQRFYGPLL